ncbi:multidrug effflux MFS transporter [Barrientosiimonas humi]|uniref:multidrug effflux MFS transporter n=1 Tax=Barrientosiimonas humi TaxID=999931 RepID=UPI00370DDB8A
MTSTPAPDRRSAGVGLVLMLALLAMIGPFTIDTIFPGFGAIADELDVTAPALQQTISVYLVSLALMSLLHGPLSDAFGRRPVIIASCAAYAVTAVACALAPSFGLLLVARAAQGVFAGAGTIVGRAMIRDLLDASAAQRLLSQVTMVFGAAPAVAPIVGGLLVPYGWRTIFWFLAALGAGLALAATFGLRESLPEQDRQPFRAGTVIRSVARRYRDLPTTVLAVATGLNFGAMFLYISSAPAIVEGLLGRGEQDYWVLFVPMIGGLVVGSYVAGRLGGRTTPGRIATLGLAISLVTGLGNVVYAALAGDVALPWAVVGPSLTSFGIALTFPVMILAILDRAPGNARGAAASVQAFTQLIMGAVISSVVSPAVSGSGLGLAATALSLTVGAALLWTWHVLTRRRTLRAQARARRTGAHAAESPAESC